MDIPTRLFTFDQSTTHTGWALWATDNISQPRLMDCGVMDHAGGKWDAWADVSAFLGRHATPEGAYVAFEDTYYGKNAAVHGELSGLRDACYATAMMLGYTMLAEVPASEQNAAIGVKAVGLSSAARKQATAEWALRVYDRAVPEHTADAIAIGEAIFARWRAERLENAD